MNTRRAKGFTLIEMVIAFAILGISLTVLYGAFESSLSRTRHDSRLSEGTLLAQSLLARAGSEWPLADGTQDGRWKDYSYVLTEHTRAAASDQTPFTQPAVQVTASVSWSEFAGERHISITTLKLLRRATP